MYICVCMSIEHLPRRLLYENCHHWVSTVPCLLLLYRRFLNITINFWYIISKESLFKGICVTF